MEKIDFREVCDFTRYTILAEFPIQTWRRFKELTESEQETYIKEVFDLYINTCAYLSCQLDVQKTIDIYQARKDERNRKRHETED